MLRRRQYRDMLGESGRFTCLNFSFVVPVFGKCKRKTSVIYDCEDESESHATCQSKGPRSWQWHRSYFEARSARFLFSDAHLATAPLERPALTSEGALRNACFSKLSPSTSHRRMTDHNVCNNIVCSSTYTKHVHRHDMQLRLVWSLHFIFHTQSNWNGGRGWLYLTFTSHPTGHHAPQDLPGRRVLSARCASALTVSLNMLGNVQMSSYVIFTSSQPPDLKWN